MHCLPRFDCREWAFDTRRSTDSSGHSPWLHDERDPMHSAFERWFDTSIARLHDSQHIATLTLPNPSDPATSLPVGLIDPTTVVVLQAFTVLTGRDATGAYVGLVGQDPNGLWRGLTGFFLAWCHGCDPGGRRSMTALRHQIEERSISMSSIHQLPSALRPRDGWFGSTEEGERLRWGGLANKDDSLSPFWEPYDPQPDTGPALVSIGPAFTDLANLVLLHDLGHESPDLERIAGGVTAGWRQRRGRLHRLEQLAALNRSRARFTDREARDVGRLPATWGTYMDPVTRTWSAPVRNVKDAARLVPRSRNPLRVRFLPPGTASRLDDIRDLGA